jgi:RimJ/RimL family protein N-acetyltransferase
VTAPRNVEIFSIDGRLVLRPYEMDDAPAIYQAVDISRNELSRWLDWCTPQYSIRDTKDWLSSLPEAWESREIYGFAILNSTTGQFLGGCGLNRIQWDCKVANLGYWVRSDRTGEGIASDAGLAVSCYGLEELGLCRIEIITAVENLASQRVAQKIGAKYEGILRSRIKIGDRNVDAAMHSLISADLESV